MAAALEAARSSDLAKAQAMTRLKDLTPREREGLTALVAGQTNKVIARARWRRTAPR